MGKVLFLNQAAKEHHEKLGIKIHNPPELKVIQGSGLGLTTNRKKTNKKASKERRQTLGQRIYESLLDKDPKGIA